MTTCVLRCTFLLKLRQRHPTHSTPTRDRAARFAPGNQTVLRVLVLGRILRNGIDLRRVPAMRRSIRSVWGAPCILSNLKRISKRYFGFCSKSCEFGAVPGRGQSALDLTDLRFRSPRPAAVRCEMSRSRRYRKQLNDLRRTPGWSTAISHQVRGERATSKDCFPWSREVTDTSDY